MTFEELKLAPAILEAVREQLRDADLGKIVTIARDTPQHDSRLRLLSHLFEHQIHHRGVGQAEIIGEPADQRRFDRRRRAFAAGLHDTGGNSGLRLRAAAARVVLPFF